MGEIHSQSNGTRHYVHGNGIATDIRYSDDGQLLGIEHSQIGQLQYHYDEQGRITGIDLDGQAYQYGYDTLGRLSQALTATGRRTYRYDAAGNRTEITQDGTVTQYVYSEPGEGNRLQEAGDTDYAYNAAGSPIQKGELSYEYNSDQRPIMVSRHGKPMAEYAYNSFGERIKKVVYAGNQKTVTYYFYDGGGRLTAEANELGKLTAQYVYLEDYRPIAKLERKTLYALHTDRLGTPIKATDSFVADFQGEDYSFMLCMP